jgi:lysophospholipase L1-like esterase
LAACDASTQESAPARRAQDVRELEQYLRWNRRVRLRQFEDYASLNGTGVAFVGDSLTQKGEWEAYFPETQVRNFGIDAEPTEGLLERVNQIIAVQPAKVFLMTGTNDITLNVSTRAIVANYTQIVDRLRAGLPETRIFVEAVFPREAENAAKVRELNAALRALADARGLTFVDTYAPFEKDGSIDSTTTRDGLHLNETGYARWRAIVSPLVTGQ